MKRYLSGWLTTGIVVSVLWALVGSIATYHSEYAKARDEGMIVFSKCIDVQDLYTPKDAIFEECRKKENEAKAASAVHALGAMLLWLHSLPYR